MFPLPLRRRGPLLQKPILGAQVMAAHPLARGLLACYLLNEGGSLNTGTTKDIFSLPGNQYIGSITHAGSSLNTPVWRTARTGPGLLFTTEGYIDINTLASPLASGSFSFAAWVNYSAVNTNQYVFRLGDSPSNNDAYLGLTSAGKNWAQISINNSFTLAAATGNTLSANTWYHIACTWSAANGLKLYLNGKLDATAVAATRGTSPQSAAFRIGADWTATQDSFGGSMDSVITWNRELAAPEIQRLYVDPYGFILPSRQIPVVPRKSTTGKSVTPDGITTLEMFGAAGVAHSLLPAGIPSLEQLGANSAGVSLLPAGIPSGEVLGATDVITNPGSNVFPGGITSLEQFGAENVVEGTGIMPGGISSLEAFGEPVIAINLLPLGITSAQALGAIRAIRGTKTPIVIPARRRAKFVKPTLGAALDTSDSITQGLCAAFLLNEGGGTGVRELVTGAPGSLIGTTLPTWSSGLFGSYPLFPGSNLGRILTPPRPSYNDIGLNGPMTVSFWFNFTTMDISAGGVTIMGKSDSTDGTSGFTAGWNINCDNWTVAGGPDSGPHYYLKLEFERSVTNKMCGAQMDGIGLIPGWHHYSISSAGGATNPTVDDFTIYLDGVLIPQGASNRMFFSGTGTNTTSDAAFSLALGSHPSGSNPMQGGLDTVLMHNRVLNSSEVQRLYSDPFCFMQKRKKPFIALAGNSLQFIFPGAIKTDEKFGADNVLIPANLSVTPLGIFSAESVTDALFATAQFLRPNGILSEEEIGAARAQIAAIQDIFPGGIVSLEFVENSNFSGFIVKSPPQRTLKPFFQNRIIY